jgi:hypothetical protein
VFTREVNRPETRDDRRPQSRGIRSSPKKKSGYGA